MTKSTITREESIQAVFDLKVGYTLGLADIEILKRVARMALAAMDSSESVELPRDYLQGHKDGLEWAARLAEANHPDTGDWLYDDPIELAKVIRKGPDMPPVQPVADSEPVIVVGDDGGDALSYRRLIQSFEPGTKLYRHAQTAPEREQLAIENFRSAMEGIGHIRRTLEETFGGLHGTHVEPDVLAECKAICDAIYAAYRHAQPAPVVPEDFDFNRFNDVVWLECVASNPHMHSPTTSAIARVALELNKRSATMEAEPDRNPVLAYADSYRDMAKQGVDSVPIWSVITDLERNIAPLYRHAQPVPRVPDDVLAALQKVARIRLDMDSFDGDRRGIADCLCDAEEALIEVVNRRAAMLNGGKP